MNLVAKLVTFNTQDSRRKADCVQMSVNDYNRLVEVLRELSEKVLELESKLQQRPK